MIKEIKLPEISENAETGTVTEILVSEGDDIEKEQSIIAVETDKASVEIPAEEGGEVQEIKVAVGDEVETGTVILTVETEAKNGQEEKQAEPAGTKEEETETEPEAMEEDAETEKEESAEEKEEQAAEAPEEKQRKGEEEETEAERKAEEQEEARETTPQEEAASSGERPRTEAPAAPLARRLARDLGVDIYEVKGSGPGNRITTDDVKAHARQRIQGSRKAEPSPEEPELPDFSQWGEVSRERISNIRKATATSTSHSWRRIPHVTHADEADLSLAESFIEDHAAEVEAAGGNLTVTALLLRLSAEALKQFPVLNASLDLKNEEIIYKNYIHIGLAVDTEHGLLVPVLRNADQKSIKSIAVEITELAEKARNRELTPEAMQGGTFVITNLGGIGGTGFTPIVYHPQAAILGVSRAQQKPVYREGALVPRPILPLSLSYDHRLIDGATAARFVRRLCDMLENPFLAFMKDGE